MEQLQVSLKSLRLGGMAASLPTRYQEAKANDLDYIGFLEQLVSDELNRRKDNLLKRRIKIAGFPAVQTLESFDFSFNPSIAKKDIMALMSCAFVNHGKNVLFIGPPGVGKTHLALAIAFAAVTHGYTVYYRSAFDLVSDMADAQRNDTRKKYVTDLSRYGLLVIDEFGMKKMPPNAADDMLEIIHRRYGNTATIIVTNRPISDWGVILGDTVATSAILDRFLDDATIFTIKGKSYRHSKNKKEE